MPPASDMLSIIVPVYKNEANLQHLLQELERVAKLSPVALEAVFVVDGSPDRSVEVLREMLPRASFRSRLACLSRNFGSFNAVRCGLEIAEGDYITVLPADLQEPADLALRFLEVLRRDDADIVFATCSSRFDSWFDAVTSRAFWALYRRFVFPELPAGGVQTIACTRAVRARVVALREPTINLVALLFWVGYRRVFLSYDRGPRLAGRSAWTLGRKVRYAFESVFYFTDLPVRVLLGIGFIGTTAALVLGTAVLTAWLGGAIRVPGYAALALLAVFFGSITSLGMGILGQYLWLVLQTARGRPDYLVDHVEAFQVPDVPPGSLQQSA